MDALCDGFLIGISAASGKNAGLILAIALTIEMGFLSITLTMVMGATCTRSRRVRDECMQSTTRPYLNLF